MERLFRFADIHAQTHDPVLAKNTEAFQAWQLSPDFLSHGCFYGIPGKRFICTISIFVYKSCPLNKGDVQIGTANAEDPQRPVNRQ